MASERIRECQCALEFYWITGTEAERERVGVRVRERDSPPRPSHTGIIDGGRVLQRPLPHLLSRVKVTRITSTWPCSVTNARLIKGETPSHLL